jgi:hypothetical protein
VASVIVYVIEGGAMDFVTHSHQHADAVLRDPAKKVVVDELLGVIREISDQDLINHFESGKPSKSISKTINDLLKERLIPLGWAPESPIFQATGYRDKRWRLDFAKAPISVEVAFNHGEAIAWNLMKPVLASRLNHVTKAIQTEVGVVVCATKAMKSAGNFDGAVGEFEKFERYLNPLQEVLTAPILLVGLNAPESFHIDQRKVGRRNVGFVVRHENF